jgi:fatty acyl-ACP thioesterase A
MILCLFSMSDALRDCRSIFYWCRNWGPCSFLQSLPFEFRGSHEIRKITLEYRREAQKGDTVESRAKTELLNDDGASIAGHAEEPTEERFVHVIRNQDGQEINKGRTVWTRL